MHLIESLWLLSFKHSKVLVKMTDKMPLLLAQRKKIRDFPSREDWCTVAADGLVFFTDGYLCKGRAGAGFFCYFECQGVICLRLSCYLLSIRSICYFGVFGIFSTEQYQSALIVGLLYWPLKRMPCLSELYYSAEILFGTGFF
jgi:hypothetical protein